QISLEAFRQHVAPDDILVVNPSFSSHMLGLGVKCRKICYVQHFNTFEVIDGFFDLYVSVSKFVARFLEQAYRIRTEIVWPFVMNAGARDDFPWFQRNTRVLVLQKGGAIVRPLLGELVSRFESSYGSLENRIEMLPTGLPHPRVLEKFQESRYCLGLSPCEGFGLMPVEAMAAGCTVVGFDGVGGRDHLRDGKNAAVVAYPDVGGLAARLHRVLSKDRWAEKLAKNGKATAAQFCVARFYSEWSRILSRFVRQRVY
ncbi:MAG TPA: glycosyltransferase, partial [Trueperaceae bacterium]